MLEAMDVLNLPGYEVVGLLGSGATSQVWRARRTVDDLQVALKVLRPGSGRLDTALAEAGLLAGVRHPHVIHLYDVLPLAGDDGRPEAVVLVTQLAQGGSLSQVLARRVLLSPGELVTVLHPVAAALADLHRRGVVHGDLSTGNVLFRSDGMPLLADLGTARVVGEPGLRGLGTGGHDGMVAPEVVEGFPATAASDVYQVGALAWRCLVGAPPGPGFNRPTLAEVAPDLSPVVLDLVARCMAPEPEDRPDADELGGALMEVAHPEPVEVAPEADAAHGLTQRLRQVALQDAAQEQPPRVPWWRRGRARPAGITSQDEGAGRVRRPGSHRAGPGGGSNGTHPRRPAAGLVALVAVGLTLMTMAILWPVLAPAPSPTAPAAPTSPTEAFGERAYPPEQVMQTEQRAQARVPPLTASDLQLLLDRRAEAWSASDPGMLRTVVLPGSSAAASELAALEQARSEGLTYTEVSFRVESFDIIATHNDMVEVRARVWSAPVSAYAGEDVVLRTPGREDEVRMELAAGDGGWLFQSWDGPSR